MLLVFVVFWGSILNGMMLGAETLLSKDLMKQFDNDPVVFFS